MMMEEFGYYDPDVAGEIYGSDDDWEEAPEAISSFWTMIWMSPIPNTVHFTCNSYLYIGN